MQTIIKLLHVLLAGAFGGLANSLAVWAMGAAGIHAMLAFDMAPELTAGWLVPRLLPSALWGLLFLLPVPKGGIYRKGLVLSLVPAAFMLLVFFPRMGAGMFGLALGPTAPFFAIIYNAVWGLCAALFLDKVRMGTR